MSQNLLNLVDMYMVGRLGATAVAAIGITSFTNFVLAAVFIGLSAGVQAMVARRMGEGRIAESAHPLNAAIMMILATALPLAVILIFCAPMIMHWLTNDPELIAQGTPYLQARIAGIAAIGINFSFRAYWSAVKMTRYYLFTLLAMHGYNIVLNWLLIFGHFGLPALGTFGSGLGTTIALYFGTMMYCWRAYRHTRDHGFGWHVPNRETIKTMIRVSIPACFQQLFFSLGFTVLFWIIGKVGTAEMAVANVLINVTLVAILPCIAFGISAATLVGQALGRKDADDAYTWGWDVAKLAAITAFVLGIPMFFLAPWILSKFLSDTTIIAHGVAPMRLVACGLMIDAIGFVFINALQGAGATRTTMLVTLFLQWLVFLPAAYWLGPVAGYGLLAIWIAQLCYRAAQTGIFISLWQRRSWTRIKLA